MGKIKLYIFLFLCLIVLSKSQGQNTKQNVPILEVLQQIKKTHSITFNYESSLLKGITVLPVSQDLSLSAKIKDLEKQTNLIFDKVSNLVYTISKAIQLCGYIKSSDLQQPLMRATITSKFAYTVSDENGYFEIELKSQNEVLTLRHIGFKTIERQVKHFNLEDCDTITMLVQEEVMSPVLIETYLVRGIDKRQDWTTSIDYKRFSLLPGLIESDVLQTVQALPSILSVDETVSNINIRGGSNDQNLILWDDIKMYQTGHFFGLISSFNPQMTQSANIINNGSDVSLTDGISGTIHMQTDKQIDSKFNGVLGVNFLNAELFSNIPISDKSSLQIASRKSLDNIVRTPTYDVYFDRITQDTEAETNVSNVTNSNQKFNFYDASIRWLYQPSEKDVIRLNFILINNDLGFNETAIINGTSRTRRSNISQNTLAAGLNYKRQWNDKLSSTVNVYNNEYKLEALNADVLNNQLQLQENIVSETSIKLNNRYIQNQWRFNLGYHFTETEIINLNDIDLPRFVRRDEEILREHGVFGQAWYQNPDHNFLIQGGIRANYLTRFEKVIIEPRLSVRQSIGDHIEIEAQSEFKHQSTSQIVNFQNDFLGIEKRRWQLTDNDSIPIIQSKQASVGIMYRNSGWLLDAKGYYKIVDGITTQSQSFTTKYEFAKEKGSYNAYGFEFLCRKKFGNFNSWLSYSYINNTYTFEALEDIEFPSNFDITHSITFGTTFSNKSWNISAGINYRTGQPTSIPVAGNEIFDDDVNFDEANNERLMNYLRIDASAIYKFKISNTFRSEIGASIWNLSNRDNAINNYYRVNESDVVNRFTRFSLGLTTNAVIRIYF
ncbi:TonB-dependent receptor plug domain-containing protein [uncultured Psychroserpens sp.]|uniref:TonB-dependent receptor n=1 Tax=uncultured Psychroserpens sp. TaxID=255436 RepID=UPI00261F95DD|nr:TonB-dependent receptor plug domain-containing protein [uncultured Psychroserpens sp.]